MRKALITRRIAVTKPYIKHVLDAKLVYMRKALKTRKNGCYKALPKTCR